MTVTNVNVTKVLFKRGNTVQNNNYTGVSGEITIDIQEKTLRIHDGTTQGGTVINAAGIAGAYSNTNVTAYLESQSITSANIGGSQTFANANAAVQAIAINSLNANVGAYQIFANANAASQTTEIDSLRANITAANSAITSLQSNAAVQAALLDTLTGNAATQSQVLDTLTSNAAVQSDTLTILLSNAVAQQTSLIDLVTNAAIQAQAIANVTGTYSNTNVAAYLSAFDGNILPAANITYSLGSEQFQWKDLWISNNTIYIGNTPIRVDGSTLLVNGAPVSGYTYSNTNVAAYLLGNITTGNIKSGNLAATGNIVTNVRHWDSAGANLYVWFSAASTPELVTLGNFGNIAGWTVSVSDGNSATVTETNPAGYFSISTDAGLTGSGSLTFTSPDYQGETPAPLTISSGLSTWTFETDGDLIIPRDIFGTGTNSLVIQNTSSGSAYLELPISPSTNAVYLANQDPAGNVAIRTGDFGSENDWIFGYNGRLNLPGNVTNGYSEIQFVSNSSGDGAGLDTIRLVPYTAGYDSAYIVIDPTYPNHIHIRAGGEQDNSPAQLFLGGENSYVSIDSGLDPNVYIRSNNNNWTFGTDGNLTIPGNINYANGVSILSGLGGAVTGNISVGDGRINFVASSSGDGNGFSTIEIRPDDVYTSNENYLIIDPTSPNHIHIRAGGTQDNSNAELYLGGENSYFMVNNGLDPEVRIAANTYVWYYGTDGNVTFPSGGSIIFDSSATSVIDGITSIRFADLTTQTTAWTGTVDFGNTIAIGYNTGTVSQGGGAVAVGSTAGNISQGVGAVAVGEAAGTSNQGAEGIAIGKTAGEQSQGAYSIAIGSAAAYYQQRTGAIAIGTSAGALQQGTHAIAIGTGAGSALQGNSSIILNATGSAVEQTTDNTFTVRPIRNASGSNVLYYDATTGEITYDTASGGTYGNTEVGAYLLTGINSNLGNLVVTNFSTANARITGGSITGITGAATTFVATNFSSSNIRVSGGYISALTNAYVTTSAITNFSTANALITGGSITGITGAATTFVATNFSSSNVAITGGYLDALANVTTTGNITAANLIGYGSNTTIIAGEYTSTFDTTGLVTLPSVTALGNLTVAGNITQESAYYETYANVVNIGGNLTCNFVDGATFYASLTANVTANFVNVSSTTGTIVGATVIVDQGATPYQISNVQINGGGVQTIRWAGGTGQNPGTGSNTDVMSFSLINLGGDIWRVLGQISNYG